MATKNFNDISRIVSSDIQHHRQNGVDLNPYSTNRARFSWQNGFDGKEFGLMDWADCYQRGKIAAQLLRE